MREAASNSINARESIKQGLPQEGILSAADLSETVIVLKGG